MLFLQHHDLQQCENIIADALVSLNFGSPRFKRLPNEGGVIDWLVRGQLPVRTPNDDRF